MASGQWPALRSALAAEVEQLGPLLRGGGVDPFGGPLQVAQRLLEGGCLERVASGHDQGPERPLGLGGGPGLQQVVGDGRRLGRQRGGVVALEGLRRPGVEPAAPGGGQLAQHRLADELVGEDEGVLARGVVDGGDEPGPLRLLDDVEQPVLGQFLQGLRAARS